MECMEGGNLCDRLAERRSFDEDEAANIVHQVLLAVAYLHAHNIVHRDLKLENLLLERNDTTVLKLVDFGLATPFDYGLPMSDVCGSDYYMAPELLGGSYDEKTDLWSIGVIAYMLLTGSPPFQGTANFSVLKKIT